MRVIKFQALIHKPEIKEKVLTPYLIFWKLQELVNTKI